MGKYIRYLFIICLLCCVLPGIYETLMMDVEDPSQMIACSFGEQASEAMDPKIESEKNYFKYKRYF